MKMEELAAKQQAQFNQVDVETMVSAQTLVNEMIDIVDIARIEKTKFGGPVYKIKIQDGTGFFTSSSMTRQIDGFIAEGVPIEEIKGCRFLVVKKHFDADPKNNKPACDYLKLEFIERPEDASE